MSSATAANASGDPSKFISGIIGLISGLTGGPTSDANKVADAADPYRSQRSQWQQPIVDLMQNPSSILQDPAFQASLNLGEEGVNRTMGAQGMSNSGNKLAALQQYGQTAGYNAIQTKLGNLMDLAGVKSGSPAVAAQALQTGQTNKANSITGGLLGLGPLLSSIFPGGIPAAITNLFKSMGMTVPDSWNTAVDSSGTPDPTGVNPPGGVDVNPNFDPTQDPFSTVPPDVSIDVPPNDFSDLDLSQLFGP